MTGTYPNLFVECKYNIHDFIIITTTTTADISSAGYSGQVLKLFFWDTS